MVSTRLQRHAFRNPQADESASWTSGSQDPLADGRTFVAPATQVRHPFQLIVKQKGLNKATQLSYHRTRRREVAFAHGIVREHCSRSRRLNRRTKCAAFTPEFKRCAGDKRGSRCLRAS